MSDRPTFDPGYPMPDSPFDPDADFRARAGSPLPEGTEPSTRDAIVDALKTVYDPEIPVDIYELGLIYQFDQSDNGDVSIVMTLTTPGCPVAGEMPGWVQDAVEAVPGVKSAAVALVWDPPWGMDMLSDEARLELGFI